MNNHWLKCQVRLNFYLALKTKIIRNILQNIIKEWENSPLSGEQRNTEYLKLKYSSSTPEFGSKMLTLDWLT